jgi:hypothetical protein
MGKGKWGRGKDNDLKVEAALSFQGEALHIHVVIFGNVCSS